ncbi:MAG: DUF2933 domain-containing protein [Nocardioidaceae bacterium]
MTNKDKYPMYALAIVAGAAVAVWAGLPLTFLLVLVCPVMMFFMMRGTGGMGGGRGGSGDEAHSEAARPDGGLERIDQPQERRD